MMLANASLNHTRNPTALRIVSRPNLTDQPDDFQNELIEGFVRHPKRFPLKLRRLRFWQRAKLKINQDSKTGLIFSCKEDQKPGSIIEATISTRKETHCFIGKVVMVKGSEDAYEIGIWLLNAEDAPKLRIVEQLCHIELYLNDKRYKDGPFLSQEKLTEEWIRRFASGFPVS